MKNLNISLLLLVFSFCFGQTQDRSDLSSKSRPNIVFIMSDDHAVSAVSAYEDWLAELAPTPNLDRIADNGMLMTRTLTPTPFVAQAEHQF